MTRQERVEKITRLCNNSGCSKKLQHIHFEQFVDRSWHPHPPKSFSDWIVRHRDYQEMTTKGTLPQEAAVKLFNATPYYEEFCEARELGLLEENPKGFYAQPY